MRNSNILRTIILLVFASLVGGLVSAFIFSKTQKQSPVINMVAPQQIPVTSVAFSASGEPVNFSDAAELAVPTVVHVKVTGEIQRRYYHDGGNDLFDFFFGNPGVPKIQEYTPKGAGSGVIISEDGYIVTNNHVIDKASEITVVFNDQTSVAASVVGRDPNTDIALLKVEVDKKLPSLAFADSDNLRIGEWVLAIGNPFNYTSTVTAGIVSAKARSLGIIPAEFRIESFIQTDAVVNPGNSGGALINLQGELVGINTAISSHTGVYEGYAFAVPSNIAKKVVKDLIEFGVVQRALLGIQYVDLSDFDDDEEIGMYVRQLKQREDNIDIDAGKLKALKKSIKEKGAVVIEVLENSAAKDAGIVKYDFITKVGNKNITSKNTIVEEVGKLRPGDKIEISLMRDGKMKQFTVILRNKAGNTDVVSDNNVEILGTRFEEVDKELAEKLRIRGGVQVVELNEGKLTNRVRKGFIITKVNQKFVSSVEELTNILNDLKRGEGVFIEGIYPNGRRDYVAFEL
jgi:S1-C subfamily serine protease